MKSDSECLGWMFVTGILCSVITLFFTGVYNTHNLHSEVSYEKYHIASWIGYQNETTTEEYKKIMEDKLITEGEYNSLVANFRKTLNPAYDVYRNEL